jgi:hypothetical protein
LKANIGFSEILVAVLIVAAIVDAACAAPTGPDHIVKIQSERMQPKPGASVPAQAGNVTELNINTTSVTKSWQGYYGNITGIITLDDARNFSMYQWSLTTPQGEVYASPAEVTSWSNVKCFNYSAKAPELNLTELEANLSIGPKDADGVNETFRYDFTGSFYVGTTHIDSTNGCKATFTYRNDQPQATSFPEVLLTDTTNVIYTTIIENNIPGFDNRGHDFQILVGENGHNGDVKTTQYYFYVEIE